MPATEQAVTVEDLRSRTTVPLLVAGGALGLGKNSSYQAVERGDFPVPVLRIGRRLVVPTAPLLRVLGVEDRAPDAVA